MVNDWVEDPHFKPAQEPDDFVDDPTFEKPKEGPSTMNAIVSKLASGMSSGFDDELGGRLSQAGRMIGVENLGGKMKDIRLADDGPTLDGEVLRKQYVKTRDDLRKMKDEASEAHPGVSMTAELGGALMNPLNKIPGLGGMTALGAAQGAGDSKAEDAGGVLKDSAIGGGMGLALGVGGKAVGKVGEKYVMPLVDKVKNAAGNALQSGAKKLAFKSSGAMLKDFRTADARGQIDDLGGYLLDNNLVEAGDTVESIAKKLGARKEAAGAKLDGIYDTAKGKFAELTQKIGFDPKRDKEKLLQAAREELGDQVGANAAVAKLSNYLDEVATRHGDAPNEAAMQAYDKAVNDFLPKFRNYVKEKTRYGKALGSAGRDLEQPAIPGLVDDLQRTQMSPKQIEILGADASKASIPGADPRVQMKLPKLTTADEAVHQTFGLPGEPTFGGVNEAANARVGSNVRDSVAQAQHALDLDHHTTAQMSKFGKQGAFDGLDLVPREFAEAELPSTISNRGQLEMPMFAERPMRPSRPNEMRNPMDLRKTNDIKGHIDDTIRYSRNPLAPEPATETAFRAARRKLSGIVDEGMDAVGGDPLLKELKAANKDYGQAAQLNDIAVDRVNRERAHKMFGLTDTIAGGAGIAYGATTDDWTGALGVVAGKKLVEKYGTAMLASTANKVSKMLLQGQPMQKLAQTNPAAFRAAVIDMTGRVLDRGSLPIPKAASTNELDSDSSQSSFYRPENTPHDPQDARKKFIDGN
jgi:hypothetical protein